MVCGLAMTATVACTADPLFGHTRTSEPARLDELVEPAPEIASRDLFYGVGGRANAPRTDVAYKLRKRDDQGVSTKFIRRVKDDRVDLYFRPNPLNWGVASDITVDDVLWTCRRLARLSERQWRDAFRAAGYSDEQIVAFTDRFEHKVREGMALADAKS
jgi:hypothetical protein